MSSRGAKAFFVMISYASLLLLLLVSRERPLVRPVEGLLRRRLSCEDRADGDLELLGNRRVDGDPRPCLPVLEHDAEVVVDRLVELVYGVEQFRGGRQLAGDFVHPPYKYVLGELHAHLYLLGVVGEGAYGPPAASRHRRVSSASRREERHLPLLELFGRKGFLQGRILEVATLEHRNLLRLGRRLEIGVVRDRRNPLGRRATVHGLLEEVHLVQHVRAVRLFAEDRLALLVDQLATLAPEVGQVVEGGSFPPPAVEEVAVDLGVLLLGLLRRHYQLVPGPRRLRHEVSPPVQYPPVRGEPIGVHLPVIANYDVADEGEQAVYLIFREVLVYRLQGALVNELRDDEGVDVRAVRRPTDSGLLQKARLFLGGLVRRDDLELQLPVRVILCELREELLEAIGPTRCGGLVSIGGVELKCHRIRGVLCANAIQRQNAAAASTTDHCPDHGQNHSQPDGSQDPLSHIESTSKITRLPMRAAISVDAPSPAGVPHASNITVT